jgi:serine/threonine-protein kinase
MKICPTCQLSYPNNYAVCPADGSPLQEFGTWSEGSVIRGKYRILAKVGQGGMGSVYKALHLAFEEKRALKVIAPELLTDELFKRRFRQEAVNTRRLQHPNAVRVDDIDEAEDGRPFIVMEFIEGKSLKKLIREEGPLPFQRVCSIIKQCASALDAAHRLGMVHRDIKPDNIQLVDAPDGEMVKVLDFGIAKVKEARMGEGLGLTLTGAGVVIGTPQYMSPEQAMGKRGDELDGRADLYSLGVVMYQMLTADLPFKADTTMEMLLAHMQKAPAPISVVHPELQVPESVAALTMRLLEKNRDMRPASGRVLIQEIEKIEKGLSSPGRTQVLMADDLMGHRDSRGPSADDRSAIGGALPTRSQAIPVRPAEPPRQVPPLVVPPPRQVVVPPPAPHSTPPESRWGMWAALLVLLVGIGGGGIWILRHQPTSPPAPSGTLTATLTAEPTTVEKGQSIILHWSSQNATALDLEPGVGKVQADGSTSVAPQDSTTYILTATGASGTQTSEAHVDVTIPPPPPTQSPVTTPPPARQDHKTKTTPAPKQEPPAPTPAPPSVVVAPQVNPDAVKGKITLGDFHLKRFEYDDAIAAYREGLALDPTNAELNQKLNQTIKVCKEEKAILKDEGFKCGGN